MTRAALHRPAPPSADKRWKLVDAAMRRHAHSPHALVETLHSAQEAFGYLDKPTLAYVATSLRVPLSRALGVATFYHAFRTRPRGRHLCVVCTGTACYIKGAEALLAHLEQQLGVAVGDTSSDGNVSLLSAHCVGQCGLAPVVVLDEDVLGKASETDVSSRMAAWGPS